MQITKISIANKNRNNTNTLLSQFIVSFHERIICYILYKDDDYIAFLFRNKSILILILMSHKHVK